MNPKLLQPYNPEETEKRIYTAWEKSGFFNPDVCVEKGVTEKSADTFSIVLPPPNVTGRLHLGHAMEHSLQDALVRFQRMRGKKTLWIPGTDHAAIATQARFEKELSLKEKKSRHDFSREEFFAMVQEFALKNQKEMREQIKLFGSSLDWSREAFTLDEKRSLAVRTTFKKMYEEGLIYKKNRIVNWDPKGQTTISDDEIVYEERKAFLYTFKYSKDFPISIATTRPETKVGDRAVAVHPTDERYKQYIGQEFNLVFADTPIHIKIIGDEEVDKDFGTGAVGITPAHSMTDERIATRHNIEGIQIINELGRMNVESELLHNKKVMEARELVVEWLKKENLLEKEEEITQNISTAERTGGIIEPLPKLQWFIDVNKPIVERGGKTLKELMREPVATKKILISPDHFEKVYFNWINNLQDWCISRQIVYGHQVPVWYKGTEMYCGIEAPKEEGWTQDTDTLDTWFSSGLWTFSTLGWPEKTEDLKNYHPTACINPGYEILFFWVARMIMMSQYNLGEIPFEHIYLHGVVRAKDGRKFSKSLKNGIEPDEVIKEYGTDALRMSMIAGAAPGNDILFDIQKVNAYKKFANKIWNASRFVLEQTEGMTGLEGLSEEDNQTLIEFRELVTDVTSDFEQYRFYLAAEKLYHYFWHTFADTIIERSKKNIKEENQKESAQKLLRHLLEEQLKLLHPFMPFITEEIWSILGKDNLLMIEQWPSPINS